MTELQKVIKYIAMGLAVLLAVIIINGIISAVGMFGGFMLGEAATEELKTYTISADVNSLDIDINAADLTIKQGKAFAVESNLKYLKVEDKNGLLRVKETNKTLRNYNGCVLSITIPADFVFERVELQTGAGRLTVDKLSAKALECEFGAGEIRIDSLWASSKADIDGGAGRTTISGGALNNLDLEMGVGQLNFTSALTGKCELHLGIGESNITLLGGKEDYTLDAEKGIGNITIDGDNISNTKGFGSGRNKVEISGGIGAVNVRFEEAEAK